MKFPLIGQPIGVTVHSECVESFEILLQLYVAEGWVAVDKTKTKSKIFV